MCLLAAPGGGGHLWLGGFPLTGGHLGDTCARTQLDFLPSWASFLQGQQSRSVHQLRVALIKPPFRPEPLFSSRPPLTHPADSSRNRIPAGPGPARPRPAPKAAPLPRVLRHFGGTGGASVVTSVRNSPTSESRAGPESTHTHTHTPPAGWCEV